MSPRPYVSHFGVGATPWLMAPSLVLAALVYHLRPDWEHGRRPIRALIAHKREH